MKKWMLFILLVLSVGTTTFAQIDDDYSQIRFYAGKSNKFGPITIYLPFQEPIEINSNTLVIFRAYTEGGFVMRAKNSVHHEYQTQYIELSKGKILYFTIGFNNYLEYFYKSTVNDVRSNYGNMNLDTVFIDEDPNKSLRKSSNKETNVTSNGTGFLISTSGLIVTNSHVVEGGKNIQIKGVNGDYTKVYSAKVVAEDKANDIAILQFTEGDFVFSDIPFQVRTTGIETGEDIFILGYPLTKSMGEEVKLTTGVVNSKSGFKGTLSSFQVSAGAQPGNSGSPLFDRSGNLIGIVNAKLRDIDGITYAVKISYLNVLLESAEIKNELQKPASTEVPFLVDLVKKYSPYVYIIEVK